MIHRHELYSPHPFDRFIPREDKMFQWLRESANFDISSNINDLSLIALLLSAITFAALTA